MCVLLITRLLWLVGRWARKPVNHTSWVALVTPTDHPKSVRNLCLIEPFCGVVCAVTCPFDISVGVGAFVIGLGQISSFLSFLRVEDPSRSRVPFRTPITVPPFLGFVLFLLCYHGDYKLDKYAALILISIVADAV